MLPVLQIGSFSIRTPGLALLAALWFSLDTASRHGKKRSIGEDHVYNVGFYSLVAGLAVARLSFILFNLDIYLNIAPWTRAVLTGLALAPGTEMLFPGVAAGLGMATFLIRRWKLPALPLLDAYAPGLAILGIGAGIANLLSGEAYGIETGLPWGIDLWGELRHPTQIYFTIACAAILLVLLRLERRPSRLADGILFQVCVILFSLAFLLIEPLRADSLVLVAGIRTWEVFAWIGLVGSLAGFAYRVPAAAPEIS